MKKLLTILLLTITANTLFAQRKYVIKTNGYSNSQVDSGLNKKLNISDTASMLSPYLPKIDSTNSTGYTTLYQNGLNNKIATDFYAPLAIKKEIDNGKYDHFGMMGIMQNGTLYVAYREGRDHVGSVGVIKFITSTDKGKTWSSATAIASGSLDYRNVGGGTTSTGRIIISYTTYDTATSLFVNMYTINSDDNGATWSSPILINKGSNTIFSTYGKVSNIGSSSLLLSWYGGTGNLKSWISKSTDNGNTWGSPILVSSFDSSLSYSESSFTYLGNNIILGMLREDNSNHIRQVLSADNGATWMDKGNATFDSSTNGMMCWLSTFTAVNNKKVVECAYANRNAGKIRVVYGYADDLINNGVAGWNASTLSDIGTFIANSGGGYPAIAHFSNHPSGIGWSTNDSLSTDNANAIGYYGYEKTGTDVSLEFFTLPLNSNIFTGTANQFIKGDGSVDTTSYAPAASYLPLSAGTGSPITGSVYFTPIAGGFNNILLNGNNTLTGGLRAQAGGGSGLYGAGWIAYSASHATKPGWFSANILSGGKFSVNNNGIGTGSDVFTVDASGNVVGLSFAKIGGSSSSFWKTDGSVDNNTYLPLSAGSSKPLTGHLYFDAASGDKDILTNENNTGTHRILIQAGGGSAAFGGSILLYANSHATHPGDVVVGLSNNPSASFRVNRYGNDGGADVFKVDFLGNATLYNKAKYLNNPTMTSADSLTVPDKEYVDSVHALSVLTSSILTSSATLDFPSTVSNGQSDLSITVTGAVDGDVVAIGVSSASATTGTFWGFVSAANTVTIRFHNTSGGSVDPASGTFKVKVFQ